MLAERISEALAATQSIAVVGDDVRDILYRVASDWGFLLQSVNAQELAILGEGHPLWGSKSKANWLFVIEDAHLLANDDEETLLDLMFDGCHSLPENTLIAAHFGHACALSEALADTMVPITHIEARTRSETMEAPTCIMNLPLIDIPISRNNPTDLPTQALAA